MGKTSRISRNNTTVTHRDGWTVCTLHRTDVIKVRDGVAVLNTGGWHTATTRTRINQACHEWGLGIGVKQVKGDWFAVDHLGQAIPFKDGMELSCNGGAEIVDEKEI